MVTATQTAHTKELDAKKRSSTACHFENALREKIVGQEEAVQALVDLYQMFCAGLHTPGRELVFLRDAEKRFSGPKIDSPVPDSGQLMTAESRV